MPLRSDAFRLGLPPSLPVSPGTRRPGSADPGPLRHPRPGSPGGGVRGLRRAHRCAAPRGDVEARLGPSAGGGAGRGAGSAGPGPLGPAGLGPFTGGPAGADRLRLCSWRRWPGPLRPGSTGPRWAATSWRWAGCGSGGSSPTDALRPAALPRELPAGAGRAPGRRGGGDEHLRPARGPRREPVGGGGRAGSARARSGCWPAPGRSSTTPGWWRGTSRSPRRCGWSGD